MKKYLILLLAFFLVFGFSSATLAHGDHNHHHHGDTKYKEVTYDKAKNITTIVITSKKVKYDTIVKDYHKVNYYTEKKHKESSYNKTEVTTTKEYHPVHDWFRYVDIATTYKITKYESWDQVKKVTKYITKTTPVTITKTTVRTIKYYGKPSKLGKKISDYTETYVDKDYGKTKVEVSKDVEYFNKNYKTSYDKEVIDVEKTYGKWNKGKDWKDDKDKDKGKDKHEDEENEKDKNEDDEKEHEDTQDAA